MSHKIYDEMRNNDIDKIHISNNFFKIYGNIKLRESFTSYEELSNKIVSYLMSSSYNTISIYKRLPSENGKYDKYIKIGIIEDRTSNYDLIIICDKEYLSILRDSLRYIGFKISKPNGGKNKQKVLK